MGKRIESLANDPETIDNIEKDILENVPETRLTPKVSGSLDEIVVNPENEQNAIDVATNSLAEQFDVDPESVQVVKNTDDTLDYTITATDKDEKKRIESLANDPETIDNIEKDILENVPETRLTPKVSGSLDEIVVNPANEQNAIDVAT